MELYLDLMKKCLLASIYEENGWYVLGSLDQKGSGIRHAVKMLLVKAAWAKGMLLVKPDRADGTKPTQGLFGYTMIGLPRLDNIQFCIEDVIKKNVPGDL